MKKSFILLSVVTALGQSIFSADLPIQNKELPLKELKAQNRHIVKLVAEEISKSLPQTVDKYTQFVDIKGKDLTLIYTFEINTGAKSDEAVISDDKTRMEKAVKNGVCQSSKRFLDAQINLSYVYKSAKTKADLFKFDITQADCYKISKAK